MKSQMIIVAWGETLAPGINLEGLGNSRFRQNMRRGSEPELMARLEKQNIVA